MQFVVLTATIVFVVITFLGFLLLLMKQYKRCPPNRILVIFGKTGAGGGVPRFIRGEAAFVWPLLQDHAYMSMEPMQVELPKELHALATAKGMKLPATWSFAIGAGPELMATAAERLVGLPMPEIEQLAADIIVGRIERNLSAAESPSADVDVTALIDKWAAEVDRDLAKVGLVTIGYR
mgnify:FL=1